MIVLYLVTWYHACDDSVGSVENATIGLLIRTDDLSWIVSLTTEQQGEYLQQECATVQLKGHRHHVGEKQRNAKPSRQPSSTFTCQNSMSCHVMVVSKLDNIPIPFSRLLRTILPPAPLASITPQPITSPKAPTRKDSHPPKSGNGPDDSPSRNTNHQAQPDKSVLQSKTSRAAGK